MTKNSNCIVITRRWIDDVVIGLNLCPFAAPLVRLDAMVIRATGGDFEHCVTELAKECARLERQPEIDTVLLVIEHGFDEFDDFLDLIELSEQVLDDTDYTGLIQLASFHPAYQFDGAEINDVENYTNRSPYPILQLLRESSVSRVLANYPDPQAIPERNKQTMRDQGMEGMRNLLKGCRKARP